MRNRWRLARAHRQRTQTPETISSRRSPSAVVWLARRQLQPGVSDANVFVSRAIIKQEFVSSSLRIGRHCHALDKDHVGDLADFFPILFGSEDWLVGSRNEFAGIREIEDGDAGAIHQPVVSAVVDEQDAIGSTNGRWARFDYARIKFSRAVRKDGRVGGFGPMQEVDGIGQA